MSFRDPESDPIVVSTNLSYVLSGPVGVSPMSQKDFTVNLTEIHVLGKSLSVLDERNSLDQDTRQFSHLEALGIKHKEPKVYGKFFEDIKCDGEKYKVKLSFKDVHSVLSDNYQLNKTRL